MSFLLTPTPRTQTIKQNPIIFEGGRSKLLFHHEATSKYIMRATTPPQPPQSQLKNGVSPDNTLINPPHHFHIYQEEVFTVVSGTMQVLLDGKQTIAQAGETIYVKPGIYHWFSNFSSENELVVDIGLSGDGVDRVVRERDERFFRNLYSYLEDCNRVGGGEEAVRKGGAGAGGPLTAPNPLQMMVFLKSADVAVAIPRLPKAVGIPLGRAIVAVGDLVGRWVFGFKANYPEYMP